GDLDTLFASLFLLRWHLGAIDALIADDPGKRAALLADGLLQQLQALQERLGAGRAAGYVHVHGEELVDPLNDRVDVVHTTGIGARTHGNDPLGFGHLFVEALDDGRHLDEAGAGNDHEIGLARRSTNYFGTEAGDVMRRGEGGGHLHIAARQTEVVRPEGILAPPVDRATQHVFQLAHVDVAMNLVF